MDYKKFNDYEGFVEKFKPKKTTDDCYTPPEVYEVIKDWVCNRYGINPETIVRPFYPGGDFENFNYPEGCLVLDNPPFSMLTKIQRFYLEKGINFFLFAPARTLFSGHMPGICHICTNVSITYENGARVPTGFVTNMEKGIAAGSFPGLHEVVKKANEPVKGKAKLSAYDYPAEVCTAAMVGKYAERGIEFTVPESECVFVRQLDAQVPLGKAVFGGCYLISERLAAERLAAERLAAERLAAERLAAKKRIPLQLSEREKEIIKGLK